MVDFNNEATVCDVMSLAKPRGQRKKTVALASDATLPLTQQSLEVNKIQENHLQG
jgi:hypothetical protein